MTTPIPTIDKIMEVYRFRQKDLADDLNEQPYSVSRWLSRGVVPPEHVLRIIKVAKKRDDHKKLGSREELALSFLRDHERRARALHKEVVKN